VAIHLLRRDIPLRILLVERRGEPGRGVAYGTRSPAHLLNVPAGRMGLSSERDGDFLQYLREQDAGLESGHFAERSRYGEYLVASLRQAAAAARSASLEVVQGEAIGLELTQAGAAVRLADGRVLEAGHMVLASGNHPPADPPGPLQGLSGSPHYIRDPWQAEAFESVRLDKPVLLIGTGLTMMDVALELARRGITADMFAVSRRGLLPKPHRQHAGPALEPAAVMSMLRAGPADIRGYLRVARLCIADLADAGIDWRDAIAALRPFTAELWQSLDLEQRRRFLRHLQPYWDVHRHRAAPGCAEQLDRLIGNGRLSVEAGRLTRLQETQGSASVQAGWKPRHRRSETIIDAGTVINCTGPQSDPRRGSDPLTVDLLRQGLMVADALGLGVEADADGALVDATGRASDRLFYVGPLLKARDWECTAVPELRTAAARLAARL